MGWFGWVLLFDVVIGVVSFGFGFWFRPKFDRWRY